MRAGSFFGHMYILILEVKPSSTQYSRLVEGNQEQVIFVCL